LCEVSVHPELFEGSSQLDAKADAALVAELSFRHYWFLWERSSSLFSMAAKKLTRYQQPSP